jgi:hypothetical protein
MNAQSSKKIAQGQFNLICVTAKCDICITSHSIDQTAFENESEKQPRN